MSRWTMAMLAACLLADVWVLVDCLRDGDYLFAIVALGLAAAAGGLLAVEVRGKR